MRNKVNITLFDLRKGYYSKKLEELNKKRSQTNLESPQTCHGTGIQNHQC